MASRKAVRSWNCPLNGEVVEDLHSTLVFTPPEVVRVLVQTAEEAFGPVVDSCRTSSIVGLSTCGRFIGSVVEVVIATCLPHHPPSLADLTARRTPFSTWSLCVSRKTCIPACATSAMNCPIRAWPAGWRCTSGFSISMMSPLSADRAATMRGRV